MDRLSQMMLMGAGGEQKVPLSAVYVGGATASNTGTTSTWTASLTSLSGGVASAPSEGDLVIVFYGNSSTANNALDATGYTQVTLISRANSTQDTNLFVGYKFMGATPDASITLSQTFSVDNGATVAIQVWRNVTAPFRFSQVTSTNSVIANPPALSIEVPGNQIFVAGAAGAHIAGAQTYASSDLTAFLTTGVDSTRDSTIGLGYAVASGSFDPAAFTFSAASSTANSYAAVTLVLGGANEALFTTPGTHNFVVPSGVTSVSAVCVGGGEGGGSQVGGTGGNIRYKNNISVTPGETLTVVVGVGGAGDIATTSAAGVNGGDSSIARSGTNLVLARGGQSTATEVFDGGGTGAAGGDSLTVSSPYGTVRNGGGGGGAGGYSGNGGVGGGTTPAAGAGGAAGGGGRNTGAAGDNSPTDYRGRVGAGGGGVGVWGQGSNGAAGVNSNPAIGGGGGSGGIAGTSTSAFSGSSLTNDGGIYGGGGGAGGRNRTSAGTLVSAAGAPGASGAVRILWPGDKRRFPSTKTGLE